MEINEIVTRAIPAEDCPVKEAGAQHRREQLKKRIEELLMQRDRSQPYIPVMEFKSPPASQITFGEPDLIIDINGTK
jgi:hypothetical protein